MKRRKTKLTAGERRFRALAQKTVSAIDKLEDLQRDMNRVDGGGKQLRQMYIMQQITQVLERLK